MTEQEAKWVAIPTGGYEFVDDVRWYECTKCHKVFSILEQDDEDEDWYECTHPNYCPNCGTKISE